MTAQLGNAAWLKSAASTGVMEALGDAYFVGGCVRNALLDQPVADIDVATPLIPDEVVTRLDAADIRSVPTGLAHGTVTAVVQGTSIEITTFRADRETDGRHAVVAFSTDIAIDAARRDFTINALYADRAGNIIDPLGGLPDIQARRVRFIRGAEDRIREDYLRILRFFRFHAWYGNDDIDAEGLAACAELSEGLEKIARERIGWEFRKLLSAPDPAPSVASMAASGVLMRCLPGADPTLLAPLVHIEAEADIAPDWPTRLAALGGENTAEQLRLSKAEATGLEHIRDAVAMMYAGDPIAHIAYRKGADAARAAALIHASSMGKPLPASLAEEASFGASRVFPLNAADIMAKGYPPGPSIGTQLQLREADWIASDFSLDKAALLANVSPYRS